MIFFRASLFLAVVTFAAFFCAQPAEAAKGPKITNKVYFDIKHGDKDMGRSALRFLYPHFVFKLTMWQSLWASSVAYV